MQEGWMIFVGRAHDNGLLDARGETPFVHKFENIGVMNGQNKVLNDG